mmetsp:Transcript_23760/g.76179  ORF Transcript_23760/g.76179 Transcript_23760/m.76179 type:complete len:202 (-) Transcript_23760:169-774(-)
MMLEKALESFWIRLGFSSSASGATSGAAAASASAATATSASASAATAAAAASAALCARQRAACHAPIFVAGVGAEQEGRHAERRKWLAALVPYRPHQDRACRHAQQHRTPRHSSTHCAVQSAGAHRLPTAPHIAPCEDDQRSLVLELRHVVRHCRCTHTQVPDLERRQLPACGLKYLKRGEVVAVAGAEVKHKISASEPVD